MAQTEMYVGQVNSPEMTLYSAITTTVQQIIVLQGDFANKLNPAPNLFIIGYGETAETIKYPDTPTESPAGVWTFTNCVREFDKKGNVGIATTWAAGTPVSRSLTAYDQNTFRSNILDLDSTKISKVDAKTNKYAVLTAYGMLLPANNAPTPLQDELSPNGLPNPKLVYSNALKGTEHAYGILYMPSTWDGGNITVQIEFSTAGITTLFVSWVINAKKISVSDSYGTTLTSFATITHDCDNSAANAQYLTAVSSPATPSGTAGGRTIIFEIKRNTGGVDTYAGDVYFHAMKVLYTVS